MDVIKVFCDNSREFRMKRSPKSEVCTAHILVLLNVTVAAFRSKTFNALQMHSEQKLINYFWRIVIYEER